MMRSGFGVTAQHLGDAMKFHLRPWIVLGALALSLATGAAALAAASPAVGDTYVYRVTNVYNSEPRGQIHYRVDAVEPDRITVSVSSQDSSLVEAGRTEIHAGDGNWIRHVIDSHGKPLALEFPAGSPGYAFPLEVGKRWSLRAPARVPQTGESRSIRVDGAVTRAERIQLPAGEFDTLKITRTVYAGDANHWESETRIYETEWYAPSLGRAVRREIRSEHLDLMRRRPHQLMRGDWDIYELLEMRAAKP